MITAYVEHISHLSLMLLLLNLNSKCLLGRFLLRLQENKCFSSITIPPENWELHATSHENIWCNHMEIGFTHQRTLPSRTRFKYHTRQVIQFLCLHFYFTPVTKDILANRNTVCRSLRKSAAALSGIKLKHIYTSFYCLT